MNSLQFNERKILKLSNVLKYKLCTTVEGFNLNAEIQRMQSYIKTRGGVQRGPLIQNVRTYINENDEIDIEIIIMLQCDKFIHNVQHPYLMKTVFRLTDCMYCRYIGPEDKLKVAYNKIEVEAFENAITLKDENYTIFVDQNEEDNTVIADVFVPRADISK